MKEEQLIPSALEALDEAIANVTQAEFDRLSEGRDPTEDQERARESLKLLRQGAKPDYADAWVVPYYVIRYGTSRVRSIWSIRCSSSRLQRSMRRSMS